MSTITQHEILLSSNAQAVADYNYWYPIIWSICLVVWILSFVVIYKAWLLHRYLPKHVAAGLITIAVFTMMTVTVSFTLTLDGWTSVIRSIPFDQDAGARFDLTRVGLRVAFPSATVVAMFSVFYIIRHKFKTYMQETKKWYDFL